MAEERKREAPINFTLSRHELLVTLDALGAEVIPGLGADPLGELSPEENQLALTIAQRAMRARGFVRFQEGDVVFHRWLVEAVGACAFAPRALMALHRAPDRTPLHYFAHLTDDDVTVLHVRPEDVLHTFSLLPSRDYLIERLVQLTGLTDEHGKADEVFSLTKEQFVRVREYVEQNDTVAAQQALNADESSDKRAFVETLANMPTLTVFQFLHVEEDGEATKKDFSVLHDGERAWLLVTSGDTIEVQGITASEFQTYLDEML